MKKVLSYVLTPFYMLWFLSMIVIFHPIQIICLKLGGYHPRKKAIDILNYFLVYSLWILGCRIRFLGFENLPENRPFIIVSNHQHTVDIPPIVIGFRKHHPKYVSKIELATGIPSISYNLRHGGSALIDRKNPRRPLRL